VTRQIRVEELPDISRGCSVLGAGGGGEAYTATLMAIQAIEDFGPVELVSVDDLPQDGVVVSCGFLGAPTMTIEKLSSGAEGEYLREEVERFSGAPVRGLMCAEIGGSNGMVPFTWAARMRLPVLDADGMGRALPEVQQVTMHLAGIPAGPAIVVDERGHRATFRNAEGAWAERLERRWCSIGARSSRQVRRTSSWRDRATRTPPPCGARCPRSGCPYACHGSPAPTLRRSPR
jgi:hypothetical protein